jgi:transforming growth factor-beta-induced protein
LAQGLFKFGISKSSPSSFHLIARMQFVRTSLVLLLAANVQAASNIVDTAVAANFTILAEALTKANLVTTLKGTGPFTVFAPTDAAFAAALTTLNITKAQLLNRTDLAAILKYHVVSGSVNSTALTNGMTPATVQGSNLTIGINGSTVSVNTAKVTSADVMCSNGVIHIIDKVLLPPTPAPTLAPTPSPAPTPAPTAAPTAAPTSAPTAAPTAGSSALKDIVDTAVGAGSFTVLAEALTKADLVTTLKGTGPFTVFAPTDAAFAAALTALGATKAELLAREDLKAILTYHVVSGTVKSTDLSNGMEAATVQGAKVTITIDGTTVKVGDAKVTAADVMCSNGVIHIIDKVLLPPAPGPSPAPAAGGSADATEASTAQGLVSFTFGGILTASLFA